MIKCWTLCSVIFLWQDVHLCCHGVLVWGSKREWREEEEWKHNVSNKILRHISFTQCDHSWSTKSNTLGGVISKVLKYSESFRKCGCGWVGWFGKKNCMMNITTPAICACQSLSVLTVNRRCVGCVWARHIAPQNLHYPMNINQQARYHFKTLKASR